MQDEKKIAVLKKLFEKDIESFGAFFFKNHLRKKTPDFHREIYRMYEDESKKRVALGAPRGHSKSTITDLVYLAWVIVHKKAHFVLLVSDTYSQATLFLEALKAEFESNERLKSFYGKLTSDNWSEGEIVSNGVMVKALGAGMKVRGLKFREYRPELILVDDLENDELVENKDRREKLERWFNGALVPSLDRDGRVIIIGTILHYDSLLAKMLDTEKYTEYEKRTYRAVNDGESLWPEHLSIEDLEKIKQEYIEKGQASLFYSEYMNDPIDKESQEFKRESFQYRTWDELNKLQTKGYLTIDTAISEKASGDYTGFALAFVDRENKWTVKAWHERLSPKALIDKIFELHQAFRIDTIGIEKTIYLQAIKPFLDDECRLRNIWPRIVELDHKQQAKETRIRGLIPRYESKSVFHIQHECTDLEDELLTFPKGIHDDVLDALAYQNQIALPFFTDDDNFDEQLTDF